MIRKSLLCCVFALLSFSAYASRVSSIEDAFFEDEVAFQELSGSGIQGISKWLAGQASKHHGDEDDRFYVTFKYIVPTDKQDEFMRNWMDYSKRTQSEGTNEKHHLAKTTSDNLIFFSYGEWNNLDAFKEHACADYTCKFAEFLDDNDVRWHMLPLKNKGDDRSQHSRSSGAFLQEKDKAYVLIKYMVPPSMKDSFEDAWTEAAEGTWKEEGNHHYSLRKTATNNHEYWVCGSWENADAYMKHFHSDHIRKLRDFNDKHRIVWSLSCMEKVDV